MSESACKDDKILIPDFTKPFVNQVSGHFYDDQHCFIGKCICGKAALFYFLFAGVLQNNETPGRILKLFGRNLTWKTELAFYTSLTAETEENTCAKKAIRKAVPLRA